MNVAANRRWFRFSLQTMFVVVTVLCVWLGLRTQRAMECERLLVELDSKGAIVRAQPGNTSSFSWLLFGTVELDTILLRDGHFSVYDTDRLQAQFPGVHLHRCERTPDNMLQFFESL